jgi:hypothetical protein
MAASLPKPKAAASWPAASTPTVFACSSATARAGSIVRAAQQEHIAPSALSAGALRPGACLRHALFIRSPRGIALTDAGYLVLARGEKIDEDLQALVREVQTEGGEIRGTVRCTPTCRPSSASCPSACARSWPRAPRWRCRCRSRTRATSSGPAWTTGPMSAWVWAPVWTCRCPRGWSPGTSPPIRCRWCCRPATRWHASAPCALRSALEHPLIGVHQGGALDRSLHERAEALHLRVRAHGVGEQLRRGVPHGRGRPGHRGDSAERRRGLCGQPALRAVPARRALGPDRELRMFALRKTPRPRAVAALIERLQG